MFHFYVGVITPSLTNELQSSFKPSFRNIKYTQASLKTEKPAENKRKWSRWTHGDISFGRVGDTISLKPKPKYTTGPQGEIEKILFFFQVLRNSIISLCVTILDL